ncbi:MAG: TIGR03084 family protein [Chloroflexi bacterium]|nr:TIGR03084 family protein [Chloroflexota bacterium]
MPIDFQELVDDLAGEQRDLEEVVVTLGPDDWERDSHAPGWKVRDQLAHLAFVDDIATLGLRDAAGFRQAVDEQDGLKYLERSRALSHDELLQWWRKASSDLIRAARPVDPRARLAWYGPDMSATSYVTARLMETWSHGLDIVDVVPAERPDTDRIRHVAAIGVRTRGFSYVNRGLEPNEDPVFVDLTLPSGAAWTHGDPDAPARIRGSATDFCRVVTQRRHLADTHLIVEGDAARSWMEVAQAFAGPPGEGRRPGQFADE